jgi:hypothetical protein
MAHPFTAGSPLQIVSHSVITSGQKGSQTAYTYNDIAETFNIITIKETGSLLVVQGYVQGWLNGSTGGASVAIKWGTNIVGRGSSSQGDGWNRAGDNGDAYRSYSIGRIAHIDHELSTGATLSIGLTLGAWSTTGAGAGWPGHAANFSWQAIEYSRQ